MYLAVWKLEGRYFRLFHMSFHFTVSNLMVSSTDKRKKKPHINCNVAGTSESTRAKWFLAKMPSFNA